MFVQLSGSQELSPSSSSSSSSSSLLSLSLSQNLGVTFSEGGAVQPEGTCRSLVLTQAHRPHTGRVRCHGEWPVCPRRGRQTLTRDLARWGSRSRRRGAAHEAGSVCDRNSNCDPAWMLSLNTELRFQEKFGKNGRGFRLTRGSTCATKCDYWRRANDPRGGKAVGMTKVGLWVGGLCGREGRLT